MTNCLRTVDKKVDNQRISLGLSSSFESLLAMRCGCMVLKAEEKFDEENTDKITFFFSILFSFCLFVFVCFVFQLSICVVQKSVLRLRRFCCVCMQTGMGLNGASCVS